MEVLKSSKQLIQAWETPLWESPLLHKRLPTAPRSHWMQQWPFWYCCTRQQWQRQDLALPSIFSFWFLSDDYCYHQQTESSLHMHSEAQLADFIQGNISSSCLTCNAFCRNVLKSAPIFYLIYYESIWRPLRHTILQKEKQPFASKQYCFLMLSCEFNMQTLKGIWFQAEVCGHWLGHRHLKLFTFLTFRNCPLCSKCSE